MASVSFTGLKKHTICSEPAMSGQRERYILPVVRFDHSLQSLRIT